MPSLAPRWYNATDRTVFTGRTPQAWVERIWQFVKSNAFDIAQPDASYTGTGPFVDIAHMFAQQNKRVATHSWSSGVGTMENIHVAFATPNVAILELVPLAGPLHTEIYADGYRFKDGYILPPDVPAQLKERSMFAARKVGLFIMALSLCVGCGEMIVEAAEDHRVEVKIDRRAAIVRPTKGLGRAMLGMVHHPDGTIFVNTQTLGLYKSSDNGKTWTASPVNFDSSVPTGQKLHGLGLSSSGTLYLLHQRHGSQLFRSTTPIY